MFLVISGFDGLYGQDAYEYLACSERFKQELQQYKIPEKFFYWPSGYFIVTSLISLFTTVSMNITAMGVSLIAGSLLAPFMYRLTELLVRNYFPECKSQNTAVYVGFITVFSGVLIKSSVVIMSDALALTLLVRCVYYLVKYCDNIGLSNLILAMILLSLSTMIRYANFFFVPVIIIVMGYLFITVENRNKIPTHFLISSLIGTIVFIPEFYYIFKYGISYFKYEGEHPTWASGWSFENFFKNEFITYDGIKQYKLINALYYLIPIFHPLYIFAFGATFFYGVWKVIRMKKTLPAILLLMWIFVYYFYLSGVPFQSLRYTMSYIPPLIILTSIGFSFIKIKPVFKVFLFTTCIITLLIAAVNHFIKFNYEKQKELEICSYLKSDIPENSIVYSFEVTGALKYYTGRNIREFATTNISEMKDVIRSGERTYFFLPLDEIKKEFKGMETGNKLDSLEKNFKFRILKEIDNYKILEAFE